jgi:hypothetical protein
MKTFALSLAVLLLSGVSFATTDQEFSVECSDAHATITVHVQKTKPAEKITGTLPDPHTLSVAGLSACDKAAEKAILAQFRGVELMMLTATTAYYYSEDCDICASLDACDLKTHVVRNVITAHSVSCSDLDSIRKKEKVLYDSCSR